MQNLISHAGQDQIIVFVNDFLATEVKQNIDAGICCARITLNYFQVNSIEEFHQRLLGSSLSKTMLSWRFLFSTTAKYLFTVKLQQNLELFCKHVEEKVYTEYNFNFTADEQILLEILRMIISWNCTINKIYVPENISFQSENRAKVFSESLKELSHFIEIKRACLNLKI